VFARRLRGASAALRHGLSRAYVKLQSDRVKLVVAIVSDADATRVTEALVSAGYPGPTRINTVGGFLRRGNATLLLGTDDERVENAIDVIRSAVDAPESPDQKRATIFVLNTARFIRV
jgi:uncharacterized protein YaaQ